jgi:hypothetical protein
VRHIDKLKTIAEEAEILLLLKCSRAYNDNRGSAFKVVSILLGCWSYSSNAIAVAKLATAACGLTAATAVTGRTKISAERQQRQRHRQLTNSDTNNDSNNNNNNDSNNNDNK